MDFAETLRRAVRQSGLTQYHLSKVTGVPQGAISNFMAGKDLRLSTFAKLANAMGFTLSQEPERAPRRQGGK